jgi:hypothetical protein
MVHVDQVTVRTSIAWTILLMTGHENPGTKSVPESLLTWKYTQRRFLGKKNLRAGGHNLSHTRDILHILLKEGEFLRR